MERPTKDEVFMDIAFTLSQRASCGRLSVGCIIIKDNKRIVTSGVNGPNTWDCDQLGCDKNKPCQFAIHAEENAINFALEQKIDLKGTTLYCTHTPCVKCTELIISTGISRVVYSETYRADALQKLIDKGIEVDICQH